MILTPNSFTFSNLTLICDSEVSEDSWLPSFLKSVSNFLQCRWNCSRLHASPCHCLTIYFQIFICFIFQLNINVLTVFKSHALPKDRLALHLRNISNSWLPTPPQAGFLLDYTSEISDYGFLSAKLWDTIREACCGFGSKYQVGLKSKIQNEIHWCCWNYWQKT